MIDPSLAASDRDDGTEQSGRARPEAPTVAVMCRTWGSDDEAGWALRQVAGALGCFFDVHVISPQGTTPVTRRDGIFTFHALGSEPEPRLEVRRDVLVEAVVGPHRDRASRRKPSGPLEVLSGPMSDDAATKVVRQLVTGELATPWEPAAEILRAIRPEIVVAADYREVGISMLVERVLPGTPLVAVPLGTDLEAMVFPAFGSLFEHADAAIVFTLSEKEALNSVYGKDDPLAEDVGLPMCANPSVLREPNAYMGHSAYVLVVTGCMEDSAERSASFARLLRARFARRNLAIVTSDSFVVSVDGFADRPHTVERGSDLSRLVAWALAMVDLRPGGLFARRSLEALLYSTPIVVPAHTRAEEHAAAGGGLWFEGPSELESCVEAVFDASLAESLGEQGCHYARSRYGSTDSFVEKVLSATGLDKAAEASPIRTT